MFGLAEIIFGLHQLWQGFGKFFSVVAGALDEFFIADIHFLFLINQHF